MALETDNLTGMTLSVRAVSKTFMGKPVLSRVSLDLGPGQAACLCGINGAGKSTLLRIVAGLLRPDRGSVAIDGWEVADHSAQFKRRVGMISHAGMIYAELTVSENLAFAADLHGLSDRDARIEELLTDTGLGPFRHDRAGILSRGLLQRLAIARALLHRPTVLLADEPFTGLDGEAAERLIDIFHAFVRNGGTLLVTTHAVRLGLRCCERVAVLDKGALLLDATIEEIDPERFAEDYLSYARGEK